MPSGLNVHLDQLAYLREAARSDTWSAAAKRLHVSQPALSQSLRELERRLGVPLFERVGRKQRLTSMGLEVVKFANTVLAQTEAFSGRVEALRRGIAGQFRVGMIDAACMYVLPDNIRRFRAGHVDLDFLLSVGTSDSLLQRLRAFELDLAVVVGPVDDDDLSVTVVVDEPMFIYRTGWGDPGDADWVLYPRGRHTRGLIDTALARRGIAPRIILESDNPQVLRQMVALGFGWSVLPKAVVAAAKQRLRLAEKEPLVYRQLVAVRRAGAPDDPRVEALLGRARAR